MYFKYKEKINVRKNKLTKKIDPKIEMDLRDLKKSFAIEDTVVSKPIDFSRVLTSIKQKFNLYVVPYITGEYKNKKVNSSKIISETKKVITFRYQLIQLSGHFKDFIFQMKMYLISKSNNTEEYKQLEKEIKEWEKVAERMLGDLIDNVSFIIKNYLVPVCNKLEKEVLKEGVVE